MPAIPALDHCNLFAARQASRFMSQLYERHLVKAKLTASQLSILSVIHHCPGIVMTDLAATMVMDRTSLLRALKPLTRDGLVCESANTPASRRLSLSLTDAGQLRYRDALQLWKIAQQEYEAIVGADEATSLRQSLLAISRS
jgi:DNA-binding MarR family transcriptional regulator